MRNPRARLAFTILFIVSIAAAFPSARSAAGSPRLWREPRITYVDPPTAKAQEIIMWAVDRYRHYGLQLPDLKVSFPQNCSGKAALYHGDQPSIEFCHVDQRTVLHEFAHAWDDTSAAVDRQAFLELRGLSVWWGGTDMRSSQQGAEHLAKIVAWGLMDADKRGIPQIPRNSIAELTDAFVRLTGHQPMPAR